MSLSDDVAELGLRKVVIASDLLFLFAQLRAQLLQYRLVEDGPERIRSSRRKAVSTIVAKPNT